MEEELQIEETQEVEPTVEPVEETPPAWDFGTYTPPEPVQPQEEPGVFDQVANDAAMKAQTAIAGLLQNQATVRNVLESQGASRDTIALAEATLLQMEGVRTQPGAAQLAIQMAIGQQIMSNKSWKAPVATTPPPAQPVGQANPTTNSPEYDARRQAVMKEFEGMNIPEDVLKETFGL